MLHPLMGNLRDVELEELIRKISDLNQKYTQSLRSGNQSLANQIRMVMNSYQEEYQRRMAELADKARNDKMLKDKVNIKK
jgi:hypothetical protein